MRILLISAFTFIAIAADVHSGARKLTGPPGMRTKLPDEHPYQKTLRTFLGTLTEKDFTHGVQGKLTTPASDGDAEYLYRTHLLTMMPQPLVGTKRGAPAVNAPASLFVLANIERPEGVMVPPVWPEPLVTFANWKYSGNVYYHNRALKLRAFVTSTIHMTMMDDQLDHHPERGGARADWFSNQLVIAAQPYPGFKDVLPIEVRKAYETGLRRMGQRVLDWGPVGEEPNLDMIAAVGLWHVGNAINDPTFAKNAESYARRLFTEPRFHPAGFWRDNRGIDMGYQGTTNFVAVWAALASNWPFAREAVDKSYRLRAHLCLPEPDGKLFVGPSHFNSRTSSDAWGDQWEWSGARDQFASLVTDEAIYLAKLPALDDLKNAPAKRAAAFNGQIAENPVNGKGGFLKNDELRSHPWKWRLWHSFNFPAAVNAGYEFYPNKSHARHAKFVRENSPWLKSPFLRDESFVRDFARAFTVARFPKHAVIVHSGPVGIPDQEDGTFKFAGPLGFGGGQLSAYWTPATGSVILGRRAGNTWSKTFDKLEEWRTWPIHAVSGCNLAGKVFTSARIREPDVVSNLKDNLGAVKVSGMIPVEQLGQAKVLQGRIGYQRTFQIDADKVRIETRIAAAGQDKVAECYETIPIFLHEAQRQAKAAPTAIAFQVNGQWLPATSEYRDKVTAVKLKRFQGEVRITFDQPQRVKLSPADWTDTFLSRARCRNLMIDLLEGAGPAVLKGEKVLRYQISP
ncbi:MAG: hypothetical protein HYX68_27660 [Planctomycetes bacterium]|nr:hypothetical protein [Planctomycetota bacterium]